MGALGAGDLGGKFVGGVAWPMPGPGGLVAVGFAMVGEGVAVIPGTA